MRTIYSISLVVVTLAVGLSPAIVNAQSAAGGYSNSSASYQTATANPASYREQSVQYEETAPIAAMQSDCTANNGCCDTCGQVGCLGCESKQSFVQRLFSFCKIRNKDRVKKGYYRRQSNHSGFIHPVCPPLFDANYGYNETCWRRFPENCRPCPRRVNCLSEYVVEPQPADSMAPFGLPEPAAPPMVQPPPVEPSAQPVAPSPRPSEPAPVPPAPPETSAENWKASTPKRITQLSYSLELPVPSISQLSQSSKE